MTPGLFTLLSPLTWWKRTDFGEGRGVASLKSLLIAALLMRLVAMALVPLAPEEAYYWMYSQHPSLSYFDHPPMVAWIIGLGSAIFGQNEFGVRIVGNLLMVGASLLLYVFGTMWFGRRAGLLSALLLQVLPLYYGTAYVATMDSALLFFWTLALVGVSIALQRSRPAGWYLAGVALGGALLSKYTGVFILAGALLSVAAYRPWWRHLRSPHPYLALVLAALFFSPVLIWNAQHDYASFRFQFIDRFQAKPLNLSSVLTFVLYQLLAITPLLVWACVVMLRRAIHSPRRVFSPRWLISLSFSVPLLAVMAHKSLRYDIHINWTLPLFLSLLPPTSLLVIAKIRQLPASYRSGRWLRAAAATAAICLTINLSAMVYLVTLQPHLRLIAAFGPWRELSEIVEDYEDRLEAQTGREPLIVAEGKYRLASELAFYRNHIESDSSTSRYTTSQWIFGGRGLGFPYWNDSRDWTGEDCIYVVDGENDILKVIGHLFESVEMVEDPRLQSLAGGRYRIAICRKLLKRDGDVGNILAAN